MVSITSIDGHINEETEFDFTIQMVDLPLPVGANAIVTIPTEIEIFSDEAKTELIIASAAGFSPIYPVIQFQV